MTRTKTPYLPTYCGRQSPGSVPHLPTYSQAAQRSEKIRGAAVPGAATAGAAAAPVSAGVPAAGDSSGMACSRLAVSRASEALFFQCMWLLRTFPEEDC